MKQSPMLFQQPEEIFILNVSHGKMSQKYEIMKYEIISPRNMRLSLQKDSPETTHRKNQDTCRYFNKTKKLAFFIKHLQETQGVTQ